MTLLISGFGRGLRLAVRKDGMRMDANHLSKGDIHLINNLTVVTNESYTDFVTNLQKELAAALSSCSGIIKLDSF